MSHAGMRLDALELIAQDHATIRELFDLYDDAEDDPVLRAEATAAIVAELEVHSALETDCFYLALASVMKDGNRLRAAFDEHIGILELARALRVTPVESTAHATLMDDLRRTMERHFAAEESELFAGARDAVLDLHFLGEQLARRRNELRGDREFQPLQMERHASLVQMI